MQNKFPANTPMTLDNVSLLAVMPPGWQVFKSDVWILRAGWAAVTL